MNLSLKKQITEIYNKHFVLPTQAILPEIKALFKPEYENYTEGSHSENRHKYFEKNRVHDICHILCRSFPEINGPPLKILDLGCGFGEFSSIFNGFGHSVTSINAGETWYLDDFNFCCNKLGVHTEKHDVLQGLPYNDKTFDVVFASEILTLESLQAQTDHILGELHRVGNRVIVINHKQRALNYDPSRFSPEIHVAVKDHINIFTFFAGERYKQLVLDLDNSARKHGYHIRSIQIKDQHNWGKCVCEKPRLIYKYYTKIGPPLLYLDADTLIVKPLFELAEMLRNYPLVARERNLGDRFNLGVMGFGKHCLLAPLLKRWYMSTRDKLGYNHTVDQKPFEHLLLRQPYKSLQVGNLPITYNFLPADEVDSGFKKEDAHILHLKESKTNELARAWRNKVLGQDG